MGFSASGNRHKARRSELLGLLGCDLGFGIEGCRMSLGFRA